MSLEMVAGGLVGGPGAYYNRFRRVKCHRVYTAQECFSNQKLIAGKRENVSLATFDEIRRAVRIIDPSGDKGEGMYREGEGTTPVTKACPDGYR